MWPTSLKSWAYPTPDKTAEVTHFCKKLSWPHPRQNSWGDPHLQNSWADPPSHLTCKCMKPCGFNFLHTSSRVGGCGWWALLPRLHANCQPADLLRHHAEQPRAVRHLTSKRRQLAVKPPANHTLSSEVESRIMRLCLWSPRSFCKGSEAGFCSKMRALANEGGRGGGGAEPGAGNCPSADEQLSGETRSKN